MVPHDDSEYEVVVHWVCYCDYGDPYWQQTGGDWAYQSDECGAEFDTVESREDWETENCQATCPKCGNTLTQKFDDPQLVENVGKDVDTGAL